MSYRRSSIKRKYIRCRKSRRGGGLDKVMTPMAIAERIKTMRQKYPHLTISQATELVTKEKEALRRLSDMTGKTYILNSKQ